MCGRTCLTLAPDEICAACAYKKKDSDKKIIPEWHDESNMGRKYEGHIESMGFNTSPQTITPVLVSAQHFDKSADPLDRVVVPMLWGMIPRWHKGENPTKHGLTTNNARIESIRTSRLYKPSLEKGRRCVVLCEGFYEWQTTTGLKSSERPAYFVYFPQSEGVKIEDRSTWDAENVNLFKVAAIFDVWHAEAEETIYSYSIITFASDKKLGWMHHRTPAVLETQEQIDGWLDYGRVGAEEALKLLTPPNTIVWHRVSNMVNNSRNKSSECNKPIKEEEEDKAKVLVKKGTALKNAEKVKMGAMDRFLIKRKVQGSPEETKRVKKEEN